VSVNTEMEPCDSPHQISADWLRLMLATEWIHEALEGERNLRHPYSGKRHVMRSSI